MNQIISKFNIPNSKHIMATTPNKTTTPTSKPTSKATAKASPKPATPKAEAKPITEAKTEAPKAVKEKSTIEKVIAAGKATSKIVSQAGTQVIGGSIQTTKTIAGMYVKAGKKAIELGKELLEDTSKLVADNQKNVRKTSVKAFKQTVETIKDSNIIENPLKGILKGKKGK